jgi:hypothetical protein
LGNLSIDKRFKNYKKHLRKLRVNPTAASIPYITRYVEETFLKRLIAVPKAMLAGRE